MSPLRWTCQSTRKLAQALRTHGDALRHTTVAQWCTALGSRVQGTRQTREGRTPPEREAQVHESNTPGQALPKAGQPVMSVEATQQECVGDWAIAGQAEPPQGSPERVRVATFPDPL